MVCVDVVIVDDVHDGVTVHVTYCVGVDVDIDGCVDI